MRVRRAIAAHAIDTLRRQSNASFRRNAPLPALAEFSRLPMLRGSYCTNPTRGVPYVHEVPLDEDPML